MVDIDFPGSALIGVPQVSAAPAHATPPHHASKAMAPSPQAMRSVTSAFATGVALVAAAVDGEPVGLPANSFTSVSLDPPLVSINLARTSSTWPKLQRASVWGISILAEHQETAFRQLSKPSGERFSGLNWSTTDDGAVHLEGASATFKVRPEFEVEAGDHLVLFLRVQELQRTQSQLPLIFLGSQPYRWPLPVAATTNLANEKVPAR